MASIGIGAQLSVEEVPALAEAQYEAASVEYAALHSGLKPPVGVLSGGNGSLQISGVRAPMVLPLSLPPSLLRLMLFTQP